MPFLTSGPLGHWQMGMTSTRLMLMCAGRCVTQNTVSAMSCGVMGLVPSYTAAAFSVSPWKRTMENSLSARPGSMLVTCTLVPRRSARRDRLNCFALTVGGFAAAFMVIFLPVLLNGEFSDAMTFLTGRVESAEDAVEGGIGHIIHLIFSFSSQVFIWLQPVIIGIILLLAAKYYRDGVRDLDKFVNYAVVSMIAVFLWPVSQQCYYLVLILLIAMMLPRWGVKTSTAAMLAIAVPSVVYLVLSHNFSLLMTLSVYTDLISPDWVLDHLLSFNLSIDIFGDYTYDTSRKIVQIVIMAVMVALVYHMHRRRCVREEA